MMGQQNDAQTKWFIFKWNQHNESCSITLCAAFSQDIQEDNYITPPNICLTGAYKPIIIKLPKSIKTATTGLSPTFSKSLFIIRWKQEKLDTDNNKQQVFNLATVIHKLKASDADKQWLTCISSSFDWMSGGKSAAPQVNGSNGSAPKRSLPTNTDGKHHTDWSKQQSRASMNV